MSFATSDFRATWRRTVERHPDRPAVETLATGARTSYAELHRQAASVAQDLRAAGVRSGHLVGLRTANRHRFCLGLLSAWLADAVAVPLSASAPDVYVRELVERAGAAITLVDDDGPTGLRPAGPLGADPSAHVGLAYVMHTSGSTGRPKPVAVSHRALGAYVAAFSTATKLAARDRFLQLAPVTFDVVFEELLPIWSVGGTAVLTPDAPDDPALLLDDIDRHAVTVAELTTVYWGLLVRYLRTSGRIVPPSLRLLLMGGEQASVELIRESVARGLPLAHVYGLTEAGITSTMRFFDSARPVTVASVGPTLSNSTVHVVGEDGRPVPTGSVGEVWVGGDSLADGYLGDAAATAARFVEVAGHAPPAGRYYRTGDAGRLDADGELELLGRMDSQIKVNGARIDLTEAEAALAALPFVAGAAVAAIDSPAGGQRLVGFVVAEAGAGASIYDAALRRSLRERVPAHLVPERVVVLDELPVTAHGKVDRQRLAELRWHDVDPIDLGDVTPTQHLVAVAWTAAIGLPPQSLDQGFVDAGGDSLALIALVVGLGESGIDVTATHCLTYPTVRTLSAFVDRSPAEGATDKGTAAAEENRQELRREHLRRRRGAPRSAS